MPWHETDPVNERLKFIAADQSGLYSTKELCSRLSVSRDTDYKWFRRYEEEGVEGLQDKSHAPKHCPDCIPEHVAAALVEAKRAHPLLGS